MAFDFTKVNRNTQSQFTYKLPENTEFVKLSDLGTKENIDNEVPFEVRILYINSKGKFNPHPVACVVSDDKATLVDLPENLTDTVKTIIDDPDAVEAINNGQCGFTVRSYHSSKYNRDCFTVDFVNLS